MKATNYSHRLWIFAMSFIVSSFSPNPELEWNDSWDCQVYLPEHEITRDPVTGTKVIFVTTDSSRDLNLYFDQNSWFFDLSMMVLYSNRTGRNELFGYLPETGELVRLQREDQHPAGMATVDYQSHDIYVVRDNVAYQWRVAIELSKDPKIRSKVKVRERKVASAPEGTSFFQPLRLKQIKRFAAARFCSAS